MSQQDDLSFNYTITLEAIESSNLAAIGYDPDKKVIAVQFKSSGDIIHYGNCEPEFATAFYTAESKGRFYANEIRGKRPAQKMTGPCEQCGAVGRIGQTCADCGTSKHVVVERKGGTA